MAMRTVGLFRTALSKQVSEVVSIWKRWGWGVTGVLNSKRAVTFLD